MNTYEISYRTTYGTIAIIKVEADTIKDACAQVRKYPRCREVLSYRQLNITPTRLTFNTNHNDN